MSNEKAVKPNWIEKDTLNMDDWQLLELFSQNILVLDSKNNSIYLFLHLCKAITSRIQVFAQNFKTKW